MKLFITIDKINTYCLDINYKFVFLIKKKKYTIIIKDNGKYILNFITKKITN